MKKVLMILLTLMMGFCTLNVSAQTTVEILGDGGTTTNSYLPAYSFYNNNLTEQIYTAEEVGMAGSILSIAFYNGGSEKTPNIKLYMVNTDQDEFTSTTDWLTVGTEDLVYEGNVTFTAGDWTVIQLDSPFEYDGTSNLGVIVDEYMQYSSGLACRVFTSTSNCAMYVYSDPTDYDAVGASYSASNRLSVKNQIVLEILPSGGSVCARPNNAVISGITSDEATLSWTAGDGQTAWEVYCDTGAVDYDQISWISVTDTFHTFTGLNPNTQYTAYVRTVCGSDVSSVRTKSFYTSMIAAQMPFFCDFEDTDVNSFWAIRNGNQANKWYIGSAVNYTTDGENALYVSNDNGATNAYTNTTTSAVWAFFDLEFADATEFDFSFDYRVNGEGSSTLYDYMKVYVGAPSDVQDGSYSTPANATEVGVFNLHDSWQTANLLLPGSFANSTQRVYFLWRNDDSSGSNPPAAVDNISLRALTCPRPESISVSDVTTTTADIHITPAGDNSSEYAIYLSGAMTGYYIATDVTYTLTGLNPSSFYTVQVRSLCGGDSSNLSNAVTFSTACDAITITEDTPWLEDFESYTGSGAQPFVCWATPVTFTADNGVAPFVYCNYGESCHSGVNSAELKGTNNMLVLPEFTNDIHDLRLSFWATATSTTSFGTMEVGVITDIEDPTSFELLGLAGTPGARGGSNAGNGNYMGPFDFNSVQASSGRIAFRFTGTSSLSWNLDDFTVSLSPGCPSPVKTSVHASNVDGHGATITWVDNDDTHSAWTVYYREVTPTNDGSWESVPATDTTVSLTGLDPETPYEVYVITNCGTQEANPDATLTITFTTTVACPAPTALTVASVTTDEAVITWTSTASNFNVEYGPVGFTPGSGTTTTVSENTITLDNLTPTTSYSVIVIADCGADDGVSASASIDFTTTQVPVELPYTADFTDSTDAWVLNNGSCSNVWMIGTANNVPALFITNDNSTPGYSISSASVVSAEKLFTVGDNASLNISFDVNIGGESSWDYLKVFFAPATESYPAATSSPTYASYSYDTYAVNFSDYLSQTGYTSYPYKINLTSGNTLHVGVEMPNPNENPNANSTAKLVFLWKNDTSSGTQPGAVISNVTVSVNSCPAPMGVADSNVTTSTADIYWTPGDEETEWIVEYGLQGFTPGTGEVENISGDPGFTMTDLATATAYDVYVAALCGAGDTSLWVGPMTFFTACDVITNLPFTENFNGYTASSTTRPNCWSFPITYSNAPYITSSYSSSAPNSLYFQSLTTTPTTAVTPQFAADINTLRVKFMLKAESTTSSGTFEVGVMSDPNDVTTFESAQIIQPANTNWNQYVVSFDSTTLTGSGNYIAFRQNSNSSSWYYWLDDVMVMPIPTCEEPTDILSAGSTSTSVTLAWTSHGEESSWNIEYGPAGFTQGEGTVVSADSNPFEVENLASGTTYDFYVQADCGGDESIWTGPYTATPGSICMPVSGTNSVTGCELVIYDDGGINGQYSNNADSYLTINPETSDYLVSVQGTLNTESCCDYLRIYDGADITSPMLGEFKGSGVTIPELTSTTGPLTLYFHSDGSLVYAGFELTVSCISNTCPKPTNMTISNITTSSADIAWTSNGSESTWNLEYKEASETDWTSVVVTGTPSYQLANLTTATSYVVRVQADCGADDQSQWLEGSFATECDVITTLPYVENFDSYVGTTYSDNNGVTPNCWTTYSTNTTYGAPHVIGSGSYYYASSGNSLIFTCGSAGSDAYAALPTFSAALNTLSLTFWRAMENTSSGTLTVGYVTNTEDLAGSYVEVATIPSVSSNGDTISVDFTAAGIPATGNICFHWNYASSYYSCCIDDVTVAESGSGPGPVITDPTVATTAATSIEQTTATLNGTITNPDNVTITAKGFEWKATTGGTYTQIAGTGTGNTFTANLSGLTANTGYTYKAFITYNGTTVYGDEMTFTTLEQGVEPCDVPTGLTAGDITGESIAISWDNHAGVNSWNIQYRPTNGQLSSATSATNSYIITGLTSNTTYQIQVQANCGDNNLSEWSEILTVTTTGLNSYLLNSIALYPNPANDVINVQCTMNDVQLKGIEVIDVYGKVVSTVVETLPATSLQTHINVSGLAAGIYFVRVTTEEGVVTKTFVKK